MAVSTVCRGCGCPLPANADAGAAFGRCAACIAAGKAAPVLMLDDEPEPLPEPEPAPKSFARRAPTAPPARCAVRRRPQPPVWLVLIAGVFALSLWVAPVAVGRAAGLNLGLSILIGGGLTAFALLANAAIAFLVRLPVVAKIGLMSGVAVLLSGVFFFGAHAAGWGQHADAVEAQPTSTLPIATPNEHSSGAVPVPQPPVQVLPKPRTPLSHIDRAYFTGMSRLEDGPAAVTAMALAPQDGSLVVGYANGTTAVWPLDQPVFEPPWAGPKGDGAVRRIKFDSTGELVYLTCDNGLIAAPLARSSPTPLKIPGERPAVMIEPLRDRFSTVRDGKLIVRLVPIDQVKKPPPAKAPAKFSLLIAKQEVVPSGLQPSYPVIDANPAFVAWHPNGKLLWGANDGTVTTWPSPGPKPEIVTKEHKGPIRAWTADANTLITGDDKGMLGYWGDRAAKPTMYWNSTFAVAHIAMAGWGRDVAVADASGGISVWDLSAGKRYFEVKRRAPTAALSYGPADDLLAIADGNGVELWYVDALRAEAFILVPPK